MNSSSSRLFEQPTEAIRLGTDPAAWPGLTTEDIEAVLFHSMVRYGATGNMRMIDGLLGLYALYKTKADRSRRHLLAKKVADDLISRHASHEWLAIMGIAMAEDDGIIVSTMALDLAMLHPIEHGDPLTGPRQVLHLLAGGLRAKAGFPRKCNEGAAFAGVLLTGDRRLLSALEQAWGRLSPEDRRIAAQQRSGHATGLFVDFWVDRLEESQDEDLFGLIAGLVADVPSAAKRVMPRPAITEVTRNFGLTPGKPAMTITTETPFADYMMRHRVRLEAMARRESDPKVIPLLLRAWGLGEDAPSRPSPAQGTERALKLTPPFLRKFPEDAAPIEADRIISTLLEGPLRPILISGIFNPFGPTLNIYFIQKSGSGHRLRLLSLNPYAAEIRDLFELDKSATFLVAQGTDIATEALGQLQGLLIREVFTQNPPHAAGTIHLPIKGIDETAYRKNLAAWLRSDTSASCDLDDMRDASKRADPFGRVDMAELMKMAAAGQSRPVRQLSQTEAAELCELFLKPGQRLVELQGFLGAWIGCDQKVMKATVDLNTLGIVLAIFAAHVPDLMRMSTPPE